MDRYGIALNKESAEVLQEVKPDCNEECYRTLCYTDSSTFRREIFPEESGKITTHTSCKATSTDGIKCTRLAGHEGPHVACCIKCCIKSNANKTLMMVHNLKKWKDPDRIRALIKRFATRPNHWNGDGQMDYLMGIWITLEVVGYQYIYIKTMMNDGIFVRRI
jgi:hypothetical protein